MMSLQANFKNLTYFFYIHFLHIVHFFSLFVFYTLFILFMYSLYFHINFFLRTFQYLCIFSCLYLHIFIHFYTHFYIFAIFILFLCFAQLFLCQRFYWILFHSFSYIYLLSLHTLSHFSHLYFLHVYLYISIFVYFHISIMVYFHIFIHFCYIFCFFFNFSMIGVSDCVLLHM